VETDDAYPRSVASSAILWSRENFSIAFNGDSARYETNGSPNGGFHLVGESEFLTSKGSLLGVGKLDGQVPGGYENAGYVSLEFHPQFAS
jgi:hypothetical protein